MLRRFTDTFLGKAKKPEEPARDRVPLATCAVLVEAASADDEFTGEERDLILDAVKHRFGLTQEEAADLIREAMEAREKSTDLWHFTHAINEAFSTEEKLQIIEEVWRIFYSDGVLDGYEDHLAHKLRDLLNLNQPQLIDAKMKILEERRGK